MNLNSINMMPGLYKDSGLIASNEYKQSRMKNSAYEENNKDHSDKIKKMRDLIRGTDKNQNRPSSVVESTLNYGKSIRDSRINSKSTTNELKKLRYNFKNISSQIRRSKTSVDAKQVASKARREVVQLKAKLQTGKYDEEELQAAIDHAKSMERAAKKKARHLEEEELISITDKSVGAGLTESELEEKLENEMDSALEDFEEEFESDMQEELQAMAEEQMAEMEQATEDMYSLMADTMEDLMEESLENIMDGMMVITDYEMTEDEFKTFKLKHRALEDKAMLEADAKYLKAIFDNYEKKMGEGGAVNISPQSDFTFSNSMDIGSNIPNIVDISV